MMDLPRASAVRFVNNSMISRARRAALLLRIRTQPLILSATLWEVKTGIWCLHSSLYLAPILVATGMFIGILPFEKITANQKFRDDVTVEVIFFGQGPDSRTVEVNKEASAAEETPKSKL